MKIGCAGTSMRQCSVLLPTLLGLCFVHSVRAQTVIPENAHRNIGGSGWECNGGYRQAGNACVAVEVPANARLEPILGHSWECNRGYRQTGNACVAVEVPANARLEPILGHSWECNGGYRQAGNACVAVEVPANARLEPILGHTWECDPGFKIQATSCVRMAAEEIVAAQQALQNAIQRSQQVRRLESIVDWSDCGDTMDRLRRAARDAADRAPDLVSAKDELESCRGESNCKNSRSQYESVLSEMRDLLDTVQARFKASQSSCGR